MSEGVQQLKSFLEPRSIALIGISRHTGDGSNVLENLLTYGFRGEIFPVNRKANEILGIKTYASVKEIPEEVDLAVILTPRAAVPPLIEDCGEKGIKAVIVIAQGFADAADEEGRNLQDKIVKIAQEKGIRIIGPNTFGVGNGFINLNTAFVFIKLGKMPVASIGQTGFVFAGTPKVPFGGKVIDLGNACDLGFADALEYFKDDPEVKVILLYIEGLREDGRRFLKIARETAKKKPILALKGGKTEEGVKVVQSHTGSLAGRNEVWKAIFRKSGIIEVEDVNELEDIERAFLRLPLPRGRELGVMTYPMACGVMATDACQKYGLKVAKLSPGTLQGLSKIFPPWISVGNPVDLTPPSSILGMQTNETFRIILETLLAAPEVAGVLLIVPSPEIGKQLYDHSEIAGELVQKFKKPVISYVYAYDPEEIGTRKYEEKGITPFPSLERAIRAFSRLCDYSEWRAASQ